MGGESFLEAVQGEQLSDSLESVSLEGIGQPTPGNATPPVDELAALLSTLGSTMAALQQSSQATSARLEETLSAAGSSLGLAGAPTTDTDISKSLKSLLSFAAEVSQEQETLVVAAAGAFDRVLTLQAQQQDALSSTVQSLEEGIASSLSYLRTLAAMDSFSSDGSLQGGSEGDGALLVLYCCCAMLSFSFAIPPMYPSRTPPVWVYDIRKYLSADN